MNPASVVAAGGGHGFSRTRGAESLHHPGLMARPTARALRREWRRSGAVSGIGPARRPGRLDLQRRGS